MEEKQEQARKQANKYRLKAPADPKTLTANQLLREVTTKVTVSDEDSPEGRMSCLEDDGNPGSAELLALLESREEEADDLRGCWARHSRPSP